jgi:eukaryotic-like serine/threonine-protein kinase
LLTKVKNFWVKGVLEKSLHQQVLISLGLEERPDAIASPWNLMLGAEEQSPQELPPETSVISVFDQIGAGRTLLILGEPGSGKTISLLQFARDLIDRAEQNPDHLIPVVFNLSSWTKSVQNKPLTLANWLVAELINKYQVPKRLAKDWVEQQHLRLLLDGLDEVRAEHRDACIAAINTFQQEHSTEIVVCSRIKDYDRLTNRLNFQNAIYLKPLTQPQIHQYLEECSSLPRDGRGVAFGKSSLGSTERYRPNATPLREASATFQTPLDLTGLRSLLNQDTALQELAYSPLMLNIMVLAYQGVAVEDLPKTNMVEECRQQLFDDYIDRMFEKSRKFSYVGGNREEQLSYPRGKTTRWLIWLARWTAQESQTIFLIERIQPIKCFQSWFEEREYLIRLFFLFILPLWLILWLCSGLSSGLVQGLFTSSIISLYIGALYGMFSGLFFGISVNDFIKFDRLGELGRVIYFSKIRLEIIRPIEIMTWSLRDIGRTLSNLFWTPIIFISIFAIAAGITLVVNKLAANDGFMLTLTAKLAIKGILICLTLSLAVSLALEFIYGLNVSELSVRISANQGIWRSLRNSVAGGLVSSSCGLIALPFCFLMTHPERMVINIVSSIIFFGLLLGLPTGLLCGGLACVQHFALRLVLHSNDYAPWNYARFLDWVTDRLFLQKVGGGYIFVHRLLMEHFAQMEIGEP